MSERTRSVLLLLMLTLMTAACSAQATPDVQAAMTLPGADSTDDVSGDTGADVVVLGETLLVDEPVEESAADATVTTSGDEGSSIFDALELPELSLEPPLDALSDAPSDAGSDVKDDGESSAADEPVPATESQRPSLENTSTELAPECAAPLDAEAELSEPPEWVTNGLEAAVSHPNFDGLDVSVSVWIDGWGEVVTRTPDMALVPASNEKILVAHAANERLDLDSTIETTIEMVGSDLVFRASGDPTFSTARARVLVDQVVAQGVTSADRLIIDVSRFPQAPAAPGWQSWQIRNFVGPLSGFMLDGNRWTASEEFLASPAQVNGEWLADSLRIAGVDVGVVEVGTADAGTVVGSVESAPIGNLVRDMMLFSNNQIADMLVLQLGLVEGEGTLADGIAEIESVLAELCVPLNGVMDDGSGLSRANLRSAREFQEILRAIRTSDTADIFESQLPISGISGTLGNRFGGDAGRVFAKTGTIFGGRALSGYASTDSGRDAVFSIVINGERDATSASLGAMDQLVRTILRS